MKPSRLADRESVRHRTVMPRFRDAWRGIVTAYREEANLRFHLFAGACTALAGFAVRLEGWEAAYLAVTILAVLVAEMVNTAVERAVDLSADGRYHPLAGQAKEIAAGAVLLTAIHGVMAAIYLFAVRQSPVATAQAVVDLIAVRPWLVLIPAAAGILGLVGGRR